MSVPTNGHEWDIYHNISPGDPRGHFLLLPALDYEREWRDQSLTSTDCYDMTYLSSTIEPIGSMVLHSIQFQLEPHKIIYTAMLGLIHHLLY